MKALKILAHITLYNSPSIVMRAIESLLLQSLQPRIQCDVLVTDNASDSALVHEIQERFGSRVVIQRNVANIGFAAAQNQAAYRCLQGGYDYLFLHNPDLRLELDALEKLVAQLEGSADCGFATPLLLRADEQLNPLNPATVDAAGMYMTKSLRHLDRTGELRDIVSQGVIRVFGGTGAALLISAACIKDIVVDDSETKELFRVYPQLASGIKERVPLFDEAFFAYREDADLAWRAQLFGWGTLLVPDAIGYHVRHVTPERRGALSPLINRWGVRNRFLLQLNNFAFTGMWHCVFSGLLLRNLIVVVAVLVRERSSLPAFSELRTLFPRAMRRRRKIMTRAHLTRGQLGHWFS